MKHGSDWYKRTPRDYLGGVQGMTAKEHAVYGVVIELIYEHGGSINNDPAWVAGWIKDMGSAAVRNTIAGLVERGKLILEGDQITQKRAKNEVKTREELSENRAKIGEKGGKNSGKSRSKASKNNNIAEANASRDVEAIRIDKSTSPLPPEGDGDLFPEPPPPKRTHADIIAEAVPLDLAEAFVEMRKKKRKPLTDRAAEMIRNKLRKMSNPVGAIEQSIIRTYEDVFEPRTDSAGGKPAQGSSGRVDFLLRDKTARHA